MNLHICSKCKNSKPRILVARLKDGRPRYFEKDGTFWASPNVCRTCAREDQRLQRGSVSSRCIADMSAAWIGKNAERIAMNRLREIGYSEILHLGESGRPDLICRSPSGSWCSVEVKKAVKDNGFNSWRTAPVYTNRQSDDIVAIVLPSGRVHVCGMKEHLSACRPSGFRNVTHLVREDERNNERSA